MASSHSDQGKFYNVVGRICMKKNPSHDHNTDYVFFNLKMAYDKWQTCKTLKLEDQKIGYFLARCKMFIKMIDDMGLVPPSDVADEVKIIRENVAKEKGPDLASFDENPKGGDSPYWPTILANASESLAFKVQRLLTDKNIATNLQQYPTGFAYMIRIYDKSREREARAIVQQALKSVSGPSSTFRDPAMYNNNPPEKRLGLHEMRLYDLEKNQNGVRNLEMLVDQGNNGQVTKQFWRDVNIYGLREAYIYLQQYAAQGLWHGNLNEVKEQVNSLMRRHGRTRFLQNPSEPTYEPDPFREEREANRRSGDVEEFTKLFQLAREWREALEADKNDDADTLEGDIRYMIRLIEEKQLRPPEGMDDKYEKVYAFFSGRYGNNPKEGDPWHTGPRVPHASGKNVSEREMKPFIVKTKGRNTARVGFRTLNAAVMYARDRANEFKAEGIDEIVSVFHVTTGSLIARFRTTGPVFEQVFIKDTQTKHGSQADKGHGLIHRKPDFKENPWLVAGPNVNLMDVPPTTMVPVNTGQQPPTKMIEATHHLPQGASEDIRLGLEPEAEDRRRASERRESGERRIGKRRAMKERIRSKLASSQRRNKKTGRFYDNPGPSSSNVGWIKVYEFVKRDLTFTGYFKYNDEQQLVTIRATESKGKLSRGFELDILADDREAAHMYKMLRKKGFAYLAKRLIKSENIRGKRAYENAITDVMSGSTSGAASPVLPAGEASPLSADQQLINHAETLYRQIEHEVAEGDFPQAVGMLIKLGGLLRVNAKRGAAWTLKTMFQRGRKMIEGRWPGAIKRFKQNGRRRRR